MRAVALADGHFRRRAAVAINLLPIRRAGWGRSHWPMGILGGGRRVAVNLSSIRTKPEGGRLGWEPAGGSCYLMGATRQSPANVLPMDSSEQNLETHLATDG